MDYTEHIHVIEVLTLYFVENAAPPRVCFLCPNDVSYVVTQWATWMAGGISVPLCTTHPPAEWKYFIQDSDCQVCLRTVAT